MHILALAMYPTFGFEVGAIAKINQRVQRIGRPDYDTAASAAIATVRSSPRNKFFSVKTYTTVSTVTGFYKKLCFVNKCHYLTHRISLTESLNKKKLDLQLIIEVEFKFPA
jgi:hypothetical protein